MNPLVSVCVHLLPNQGKRKPQDICSLWMQSCVVKGDRRRQQQVAGIADTGNNITKTLK